MSWVHLICLKLPWLKLTITMVRTLRDILSQKEMRYSTHKTSLSFLWPRTLLQMLPPLVESTLGEYSFLSEMEMGLFPMEKGKQKSMSRLSIMHSRRPDKIWFALIWKRSSPLLVCLKADITTLRSKSFPNLFQITGVTPPFGKCLSTQAFSTADSLASVERETHTP